MPNNPSANLSSQDQFIALPDGDTRVPDLGPAPATQDPHFQAPTSQDNLCRRCESLHIGTLREERGELVDGVIARIQSSSLHDDCALCIQFAENKSLAVAHNPSTINYPEFVLSRKPFSVSDERGIYQGHSLSLHFELSSLYEVRLYPSTGRFRKNGQYHGVDRSPLGNVLDPYHADFSLARHWLRTCRARHPQECSPSPPRTDILRLIDCRTRRIVPATHGQHYVCLSYVWGAGAADISRDPTILPDVVPKTVEDAMFVAANLDVPFLWVDRYCIDQSNVQEKHTIIQNMDLIYKGGDLTIIASYGSDPHHGLPGVRGTTRRKQHQLRGPTFQYLAAEPVVDEILHSTWNDRGWTVRDPGFGISMFAVTNVVVVSSHAHTIITNG